MNPRWRIAAIIPAHDEGLTIGQVVQGLHAFAIHRILVVDDASSDDTGVIARAAGAEVLRLAPGQGGGKGQALRAGIDHLKSGEFDFYLFIDGDGQHDPKDLQKFIDHLALHPQTDFLIGSRLLERHHIPKARWRTNALGTWTLNRIAGTHWEDTQSGFRMVRKNVLDRLDLRGKGFTIEMEIAMKAAHNKIQWAHVPIRAIYHKDIPSHFRGVLDTWLIAYYSLNC